MKTNVVKEQDKSMREAVKPNTVSMVHEVLNGLVRLAIWK